MTHPNFILLYVQSPADSVRFYRQLFQCEPIESSETFAMFALQNGLMLGCWQRTGVKPTPSAHVGGSEMAIAVDTKESVQTLHQAWESYGVNILQEPTMMDFGYTFVGADPDGHRIRVFAPN